MRAETRCGLVAVVGAPNAGKSTLVNALAGAKVTIVSPKPQTTRFRIRAVVMRGASQIVLVDTPGIFAPRRRLDRAMVAAAWGGAQDADLTLLIVDSRAGLTDPVRAILDRLAKGAAPRVAGAEQGGPDPAAAPAAAGRRDQRAGADGGDLHGLGRRRAAASTGCWTAWPRPCRRGRSCSPRTSFPTCRTGCSSPRSCASRSCARPMRRCRTTRPSRPRTGRSARTAACGWIAPSMSSAPTQKAILIGDNGARIKAIGSRARRELEALLERRVHLFLNVKDRPGLGRGARAAAGAGAGGSGLTRRPLRPCRH